MSITFLSSGILTTVQDLGRRGARRYGIGAGGAMDPRAVRLIDILLGNDENEAVIEMHYPAPQIRFDAAAVFALGGADFAAVLDDQPVDNWRPHFAAKGSVLKFSDKRSGTRAYLAVRGGFEIESWLGSAATNIKAQAGGFHGRALKKDDVLQMRNAEEEMRNGPERQNYRISFSMLPRYSRFPTVRVIPGAEYHLLSGEAKRNFTEQHFNIGLLSDRMGFRLAGDPVMLETPHEFISSAVSFGTVQLLPDGQLIVLMADHQTTGGYPRLAHVITHDLPLIGQLGAHDGVGFHVIDIDEAGKLLADFESELRWLRTGVGVKL